MTVWDSFWGGNESPVFFFFDGTVRVYCQFSLDPKLGIEPRPQSKQQESVGHPI